jgi:hypothetical protein
MKKILVIIIAFCCNSCNKSDLYSFYSNGLISDFPNDRNFEYYIIIPHAGCPGCITTAEDLLLHNKNSSKYFFIITNFTSKKSLVLKLGKDIMDCNNVILDSLNNYYAKSFKENIYPISILLEKNRIQRITVGVP